MKTGKRNWRLGLVEPERVSPSHVTTPSTYFGSEEEEHVPWIGILYLLGRPYTCI
ncbi:Fungal specific transcription factor domain family protein [Aspergillus niger]|uniref:Fungal specific transcription factor domain family protein n=1 Tax=Aspergillus niger TaxID=5061 RepID=A0A505IH65_ASPNG|nr:Fungal specific transcription factor domain family protein [Aspergillus niger]